MYTVYHNGSLMYTPAMTEDDAYVLIDPVLSLELNSSGTFTATVPKDNSQYGNLGVMSSIITVFDGTYSGGNVVWQGRVISIDSDMWGNKKITAEGDLSLLADYYEPSFERYGSLESHDYVWTGTVQRFWELLLAHYNAIITIDGETDTINKYIRNMDIDSSVGSLTLSIEQKSFTSGLDMITNELLEQVGGYVWIEWTNYGTIRTLHHSLTSGDTLNQSIRFGENMIDINQCINGTALYTAIIAEGPNDDSGVPYTLRSSDVPTADKANYSISNYRLYSTAAVNLFGRIEHYEKFDDATNYSDLYTKAKYKLDDALAESMTITVTAADLHYIDDSNDRFKLGSMIQCVSKPHGLNSLFRMTAMEIPLDQPEAEEYTLGLAVPSLSILNNTNTSKVKTVSKNAVTVKKSAKVNGGTSSSSKTGYINLGDELVIAYGYVPTKSVGTQKTFSVDYSGAGFRSTPIITTVPCCTDKGSGGATISSHIMTANSTGATVSVLKTAGTNNVGLMWIAIGY